MVENGGGGAQAGEQARAALEGARDRLEGARGVAEDAVAWLRGWAQERPGRAIAVAAVVGFLAGRLAART
jgi:ElaB/YqjD/DUF883 family membrane-anchored ribosome-binding protein